MTIDTSKPSIARVYDALLGGKDNFAVDHELMHQLLTVSPEVQPLAVAHRDWSRRVIRWLATDAGVDQFLDCGCGLPTMENTHEVAQDINPDSTVVYVDNDPSVAAHGRALLTNDDRTVLIEADLTDPVALLQDVRVTTTLNLDRPVALIQCATIHHIASFTEARQVMAAYVDLLPSGSYVAMTHAYDPGDGSNVSRLAQHLQAQYRRMNSTTTWRSRTDIEALFEGTKLVEPGLTFLYDWWPAGPPLDDVDDVFQVVLGGVGQKP